MNKNKLEEGKIYTDERDNFRLIDSVYQLDVTPPSAPMGHKRLFEARVNYTVLAIAQKSSHQKVGEKHSTGLKGFAQWAAREAAEKEVPDPLI